MKKLNAPMWVLVFALLLIVREIQAESVSVALEPASATPEGRVDLSMVVQDAENLGSLQFDLMYDPEMLATIETPVSAGNHLRGAMIEANVVTPGTLRVALISGEPVAGTGQILTIAFNVNATASGTSSVSLKNVRAWDHEQNLEMLVSSSGTEIMIKPALPMLWIILGAVGVLLILGILVAIVLGRKS